MTQELTKSIVVVLTLLGAILVCYTAMRYNLLIPTLATATVTAIITWYISDKKSQ